MTTLTEDVNTPFHVPTTTEDNPMSSPSSAAAQPAHFYSIAFNSYIHHAPHPFYPALHHPVLPPGQSDLEILEQLKKSIKDGQHDFYHTVPQPAVLAGMYLGPAAP